jgi:hypothetical protein
MVETITLRYITEQRLKIEENQFCKARTSIKSYLNIQLLTQSKHTEPSLQI